MSARHELLGRADEPRLGRAEKSLVRGLDLVLGAVLRRSVALGCPGLGVRVWGLGFIGEGAGFRVSGFGFRV